MLLPGITCGSGRGPSDPRSRARSEIKGKTVRARYNVHAFHMILPPRAAELSANRCGPGTKRRANAIDLAPVRY
eukprot:1881873-Rhodomonas_salina.1